MKTTIKKSKLAILSYLIIAVAFFVVFIRGNSYLNNPAHRFYADTLTYYKMSHMNMAVQSMVGLKQNFLGPLLVIVITGKDLFFAFLFNLITFTLTVSKFFNTYENKISTGTFTLYLLMNILLFASLLLVNKEIFALVSILLFLVYEKEKDNRILFVSCIFALFTRWQHLFIYIVYFLFRSKYNPFKRKNIYSIFLLILFINTFYSVLFSRFGAVYSVGTMDAQKEKAGLLIDTLDAMQNNFMYVIALPVKILLNLVGNVVRAVKIFSPSYVLEDVYNNLFILGHQIAAAILLFKMIQKKKFDLKNDIFFLSVLFCIFYSMSSMVQYRYFYVVYVIWAFILSEGTTNTHTAPVAVKFEEMNKRDG